MTNNPKPPSGSPASDNYTVLAGPGTVRLERLLPGPIERVWAYLTEPELRGSWLASGKMDLFVGGQVEHIFHNNALTEIDAPPPAKYERYGGVVHFVGGRILVCEPPNLLSYVWPEEKGASDSEVTFELSNEGDKVRLVLTHSKLTSRGDVVGVSGGWHAHVDILAARLAGETPHGFWSMFNRLEAEYEAKTPADPIS